MPLHMVRLGSPRAPGEGLRIGTVRRPEFARAACLAWLLGQRHPGQPALRHELPVGLGCEAARGLEAGRA
jgi:hypothetical protein